MPHNLITLTLPLRCSRCGELIEGSISYEDNTEYASFMFNEWKENRGFQIVDGEAVCEGCLGDEHETRSEPST